MTEIQTGHLYGQRGHHGTHRSHREISHRPAEHAKAGYRGKADSPARANRGHTVAQPANQAAFHGYDGRHRGRTHHAGYGRGARLYHRAAEHNLARKFPESFSFSASVSTFTTDPDAAQEAAQSLLTVVRALLAQAARPGETTAAIRDSLTDAQTEAAALAADSAEIDGVETTAALVDDRLAAAEDATEDSAESPPATLDDPIALQASRRQAYSLRIRTQEGDVVKISLHSSEFLSIAAGGTASDGAEAEAEPATEFALQTNARLKLRVFGDISDAELEAIGSVFEQAAEIAENFFNGDLSQALAATGELDFDTTQIAKIRLNFRSLTSVSALYAPPQSAPPEVPAPGIDTPAAPVAAAPAAPAEAPGDAAPAAPAQAESAPDVATTAASETGPIDTIDALVDAISEFFASFVAGLEALQARDDASDEDRYRLVTAFKLDVLKATLVASADEATQDVAAQTAEAIDEAATAEAA